MAATKAIETACGGWVCPMCGSNNPLLMIEGEELDRFLECPICDHESGEITWSRIEDIPDGAWMGVEEN